VSKLLFLWAFPLLRLGFRKPLEVHDLWEISPKNMARNIYARFKANLDAQKISKEKRYLFLMECDDRIVWQINQFLIVFFSRKTKISPLPSISSINLPLTLVKTFWGPICIGGAYKFVHSILSFALPQILRFVKIGILMTFECD